MKMLLASTLLSGILTISLNNFVLAETHTSPTPYTPQQTSESVFASTQSEILVATTPVGPIFSIGKLPKGTFALKWVAEGASSNLTFDVFSYWQFRNGDPITSLHVTNNGVTEVIGDDLLNDYYITNVVPAPGKELVVKVYALVK